MTAALRVLLPSLFGELNLHRIEAVCIPTNASSVRVLEKCGFTREGLARRYLCINGVWQDHLLFGLLHEDFSGKLFFGCGHARSVRRRLYRHALGFAVIALL